jgi:hypothetical protein
MNDNWANSIVLLEECTDPALWQKPQYNVSKGKNAYNTSKQYTKRGNRIDD